METASQHQEQPILNIIGEKVALGPLCRDLLPLYVRWFNDLEVTRTLLTVRPGPMTRQAEEAWFEDASTDDHNVRCSSICCRHRHLHDDLRYGQDCRPESRTA